MRVEEFLALRWSEPEGPLIEPPRFSPVIADPSFLFPEETAGAPDGGWALFAHSAWGVHRYASDDGLAWRDRSIVLRNAMRPFARRIDEADVAPTGAARPNAAPFHLYAEAYPPLALPLTALPGRRKWRSAIVLARSADLARWSRPEVLARPDLPWMSDPELGSSVSNPCLVREPGRGDAIGGPASGDPGPAGGPSPARRETAPRWRLYYSASLVYLPDCGFCEPRFIACARGPAPEGPFIPEASPLIDPANDALLGTSDAGGVSGAANAGTDSARADSARALGAGSIKALALADGYIGLQNKIYRDPSGKSRSAIFLLRSEDGLSWRAAREEPLLAPAAAGWTSSHVYACDCRFREQDGAWYLYFNARDGWRISEGKERIGRIVGRA